MGKIKILGLQPKGKIIIKKLRDGYVVKVRNKVVDEASTRSGAVWRAGTIRTLRKQDEEFIKEVKKRVKIVDCKSKSRRRKR